MFIGELSELLSRWASPIPSWLPWTVADATWTWLARKIGCLNVYRAFGTLIELGACSPQVCRVGAAGSESCGRTGRCFDGVSGLWGMAARATKHPWPIPLPIPSSPALVHAAVSNLQPDRNRRRCRRKVRLEKGRPLPTERRFGVTSQA